MICDIVCSYPRLWRAVKGVLRQDIFTVCASSETQQHLVTVEVRRAEDWEAPQREAPSQKVSRAKDLCSVSQKPSEEATLL